MGNNKQKRTHNEGKHLEDYLERLAHTNTTFVFSFYFGGNSNNDRHVPTMNLIVDIVNW